MLEESQGLAPVEVGRPTHGGDKKKSMLIELAIFAVVVSIAVAVGYYFYNKSADDEEDDAAQASVGRAAADGGGRPAPIESAATDGASQDVDNNKFDSMDLMHSLPMGWRCAMNGASKSETEAIVQNTLKGTENWKTVSAHDYAKSITAQNRPMITSKPKAIGVTTATESLRNQMQWGTSNVPVALSGSVIPFGDSSYRQDALMSATGQYTKGDCSTSC